MNWLLFCSYVLLVIYLNEMSRIDFLLFFLLTLQNGLYKTGTIILESLVNYLIKLSESSIFFQERLLAINSISVMIVGLFRFSSGIIYCNLHFLKYLSLNLLP